MSMNPFLVLHLSTIVPVLLLGPVIFLRQRGDRRHVLLGRTWAILMVISCFSSFGLQSDGHLSWLHALSAYTLLSVGQAVIAIRKKDIKTHQRAMLGSYLGACVAFVFAAAIPTRLIGSLIRKLLL